MRFGVCLLLAALLLAVLDVGAAHADVVVLRNGRRIEGQVRIQGDKIEITAADNTAVTVTRAEVEKIEASAEDKPKDFQITDELRRRVEQHERLKTLAVTLDAGGPPAVKAARELCDAGPDALPFLGAAVGGGDENAARIALRALASIGVRSAADVIAARLPEMKPDLQVAALEALGDLRAVHTAPAIAALVANAATPQTVQQAGIATLAKLRSGLAIPVLIEAFEKPATTKAAAEALGSLASPSALPYLELLARKKGAAAGLAAKIIAATITPDQAGLLDRLKKSDDAAVRNAAADALKRLNETRAGRVAVCIARIRAADKAEADAVAAQLAKLTGLPDRTPNEWLAWWTEQNAGRAHLALITIGAVDPALVRQVRRVLEQEPGLKVVEPAKLTLSRWSQAPGSQRFRADVLLDQVERAIEDSPQDVAVIGLTNVPIEIPGTGPVIGAFRPGKCGVISLPALGAGDDAKLLSSRLARYALHALARTFRVTKADAATCPAAALYEHASLDRLNDAFSAKTADNVKKSVGVSISELSGDLDAAVRTLDQLTPVTDERQTAIELGLLAERRLDLNLARRFWLRASTLPGDPGETDLIKGRIALIERLAAAKKQE